MSKACTVLVLLVLSAAGAFLPSWAQAQDAAPADAAQSKRFALRNLKSTEAARVLRELWGGQADRKGTLKIAVDERSNSVVVVGPPADLARVADLLADLDNRAEAGPGERSPVQILELGRLDPDESLEATLKMVFRARGNGQFVLDRKRRVVIACAEPAVLAEVQGLLRRLAELPRVPAESAGPGGAAKAFSMRFRNEPWGPVLKWLSEQTRLPVIANVRPLGTFTFDPPAGKEYTIGEVLDILNDALAEGDQKFILIKRDRAFTLVPADEPINFGFVPEVRPEDLDGRGKTEVVSVVFPVPAVPIEQAAADARKIVGPFGQVVPIVSSSQLRVMDTAGNLRRVRKWLQDVGQKSAPARGQEK